MQYTINGSRKDHNHIILTPTTWDDYGYKTCFICVYIDENGKENTLGTIKIAKTNQSDEERTVNLLPDHFTKLSSDFYSVWQDAECYKKYMI